MWVWVWKGGGVAKHAQTWIVRHAWGVIAFSMCCIFLSCGMQVFCFVMPRKKWKCEHTQNVLMLMKEIVCLGHQCVCTSWVHRISVQNFPIRRETYFARTCCTQCNLATTGRHSALINVDIQHNNHTTNISV